MLYHVKYANLNAYADDHQIYSSNLDPLALEECTCQEVNVANQWYKNNGMIVNKIKHQALNLGKTEHKFCFPVNDSIDIFGMTIDNKLSFDNQFNVMLRFRTLINKKTLLKLYKDFILPLFYYCSSVWHLYGACNTGKVDNFNKRILRILQNFMIILCKSLFSTYYPVYIRDMLTVHTSSYNLRVNYILDLPKAKTTTYGLHSFSY